MWRRRRDKVWGKEHDKEAVWTTTTGCSDKVALGKQRGKVLRELCNKIVFRSEEIQQEVRIQ